MKSERKQQSIWIGVGIITRTVRHIQQWDGRTVGIVRNGYGAEVVVQFVEGKNRWDVLSGVSAIDDLTTKQETR